MEVILKKLQKCWGNLSLYDIIVGIHQKETGPVPACTGIKEYDDSPVEGWIRPEKLSVLCIPV
jgi:hypothetical protein